MSDILHKKQECYHLEDSCVIMCQLESKLQNGVNITLDYSRKKRCRNILLFMIKP